MLIFINISISFFSAGAVRDFTVSAVCLMRRPEVELFAGRFVVRVDSLGLCLQVDIRIQALPYRYHLRF